MIKQKLCKYVHFDFIIQEKSQKKLIFHDDGRGKIRRIFVERPFFQNEAVLAKTSMAYFEAYLSSFLRV